MRFLSYPRDVAQGVDVRREEKTSKAVPQALRGKHSRLRAKIFSDGLRAWKTFRSLDIEIVGEISGSQGCSWPSINNVPDVLSTSAPRPRRRCVSRNWIRISAETMHHYILHAPRRRKSQNGAPACQGTLRDALSWPSPSLSPSPSSPSPSSPSRYQRACLGTPRTQDPAGRQQGSELTGLRRARSTRSYKFGTIAFQLKSCRNGRPRLPRSNCHSFRPDRPRCGGHRADGRACGLASARRVRAAPTMAHCEARAASSLPRARAARHV